MKDPTDVKKFMVVRGGKKEVEVEVDDLEPVVDELKRRGRLYDAVLGAIRYYARSEDPTMTLDEAAGLMIDFPLFLAELRQNWSGEGFVREMPNVLGPKAHYR